MRRGTFSGIAALLSLGASAAMAEPRLLQVPMRYVEVPPMEAGSRPIKAGERLFIFPMRWQQSASLAAPFSIVLDGREHRIAADEALAINRVDYGDPAFATALTFCQARLADPGEANNPLSAAVLRAMRDTQLCVVDTDRDGQIDHAMLLNGGSQEARTPRPVEASSYRLGTGGEVGAGDRFTLVYNGGRRLSFFITQQGRTRAVDWLSYQTPTDRKGYAAEFKARRQPDGRFLVEAPGLRFHLTDVSADELSARMHWDASGAEIIPMPDEVSPG